MIDKSKYKTMLEKLYTDLFFAFICMVCGYSYHDAYPSKKNKEEKNHIYIDGCLDGSINVLSEFTTKGYKLQSCEDMAKEEFK